VRVNENLENLRMFIERARSIHGHLGPFLVLGVKIGLAGMEKLEMEDSTRQLHVEAELPKEIPYTCTLDGIQVTTRCTVGNQKLYLKKSNLPLISAKFNMVNKGKRVVISVRDEILQTLIKELKKSKGDKATQEKLAWMIASMPEEKLFSIKIQ